MGLENPPQKSSTIGDISPFTCDPTCLASSCNSSRSLLMKAWRTVSLCSPRKERVSLWKARAASRQRQVKGDGVAFFFGKVTGCFKSFQGSFAGEMWQSYPSQRLEQQGAQSVRPFHQVLLQLVVVQRGQHGHLLPSPGGTYRLVLFNADAGQRWTKITENICSTSLLRCNGRSQHGRGLQREMRTESQWDRFGFATFYCEKCAHAAAVIKVTLVLCHDSDSFFLACIMLVRCRSRAFRLVHRVRCDPCSNWLVGFQQPFLEAQE